MKKLIFTLVVTMITTFSLTAQTVVSSKLFDDVYVGVSTGGAAWLHPYDMNFDGFVNSMHSVSQVRLGKLITPTLGFELDGEVGMAYRSTFVDHLALGGNALFNVNNMVHKYKGNPDRVELVPFVGINWYHTYGDVSNNIGAKMGTYLNFNLGKDRKWQINVIPSINYVLTDNGFHDLMNGQPKFDSQRAYLNMQVGLTYKFKNSKKTHNFVLCPYSFTADEYNALKKEIAEYENALNKARDEYNEQAKLVVKQQQEIDYLKARDMNIENIIMANSAIGFEIGKSKILPTHKAALETIAEAVKDTDTKLTIVGYADAKTGNKSRNLKLSEERALAVKNALVILGVNPNNINVDFMGDTVQPFGENDMNRVVVFKTK